MPPAAQMLNNHTKINVTGANSIPDKTRMPTVDTPAFRMSTRECKARPNINKANLRDLIAAAGLVILIKLDSIVNFSARVTLKFDGWPRKIIGHLFYTTLNFVHHFKAIGELKLELQSGNAQFGSKSAIFCTMWPWNFIDVVKKQ